jgi:hypothetical protein
MTAGECTMKISFRDRMQAIKHSKVYQKDYQQYVKKREQDVDLDAKIGPPWDPRIHLSTAGKRLCRKWGLQFPMAPDSHLEPVYYPAAENPCVEVDYSKLERAADCPAWMIDGVAYPVSFPTDDELKKPSSIGVANSGGYKVVTHVNGKLCLLIDISYPSDMIMDVLREFINHYAQETEERRGVPKEDPWRIYLMYHKGMNLLKITTALHGVSKQPAYDQEADTPYRRVSRAYSKALRMIKSVEKEAEKRKHPPKS